MTLFESIKDLRSSFKMTKHIQPSLLILAGAAGLACSTASAQNQIAPTKDLNVSLKLEIERAITKGVDFLESEQDAKTGSWSDTELPAISAMATAAIAGDPGLEGETKLPNSALQGYQFLLSQVQPDGGIYAKGLSTYNTAISLMAMLLSGDEAHLPVIAEARKFLVGKQQDFNKPGVLDHPFDGGIGYGDGSEAANMSTTKFTLGALYHSKQVLADTEYAVEEDSDLDWDAAIAFVARCQNSEDTVKKSDSKLALRTEDEGGFVYFPGSTKSDTFEIEAGDGSKAIALRSYGSISYAGMMSFLYADMDIEDPRVQSVLKWLQGNFTLEENPGMEAEGLFYYYHTMAKALTIAGVQKLEEPDGNKIDWKKDLALKLMSQQQRDGSWINDGSNRWMEGDPILVTAYSLQALQQIYRLL